MSDERFRRRIAEIASVDGGVLSDAARERILSRIVQEGPSLVRGARWKRRMLYAAGPVLAAAAAVAFLAKTDVASPRANPVAASNDKKVEPAALACASRPVPAVRDFTSRPGGASLDLGEVALAVADPGAAVSAERLDACHTVIGLTSGRVTVHARNLGGGELSVRAPGGLVTVKGTIFSVTQNPDALVVEVAEGTVAVNSRSGEHLVHHGERLHLSAVGVAQGALDGPRENALRAVIGVPSVVGFEALPEGEVRAPESSGVAVQPRAALASRVRAPHASEASDSNPPRAVEAPEAPVAEALPEPAVKLPETAAKAETAADWLTQAEHARKTGKFAEARTLYRRVAEQGSGTTAEAAWVALARMELSLGHPAAARDATKRRQERFGHGTLEPEALWIDVRTYRQSGDVPRARSLAEELVRRWPKSPQARAAEQWLSSGE